MGVIETVKIVSGDTEAGFVIINKEDLVEGEHELFVEKATEKMLGAGEPEGPTRAQLLKTRKAELIAMAEEKGIEVVPDEVTVEKLVDLILAAE